MDEPPPEYQAEASAPPEMTSESLDAEGLAVTGDLNLYDNVLPTGAPDGLDNSAERTGGNGDPHYGNNYTYESLSNFGIQQPPPYSDVQPTIAPPPYYTLQNPCSPSYSGQVRYVLVQPTYGNQQGLQQQQQQQQQQAADGLDSRVVIRSNQLALETVPVKFPAHTTLACFVFWLCGFLFGLVAYILALKAEQKETQFLKTSRRLRRASLTVSILGIVAGAIVIAVVLGVWKSDGFGDDTTDPTDNGCYSRNEQCFKQKTLADSNNCFSGLFYIMYYDGGYCYNNCSPTAFIFRGQCFEHRSYIQNINCTAAHGINILQDNIYCYYNCPVGWYFTDGKCYEHRTTSYVYDSTDCSSRFGAVADSYYSYGYCYFNCKAGSFFVNEKCYVYRQNNSNCSIDRFDAYFDGWFCYFNCPVGFYPFNAKCFGFRFPVSYRTYCYQVFGPDAYYDGLYCYHNCTGGLFAAGGTCFSLDEWGYTNSSCRSTFGLTSYYDGTYCYHNCSLAFPYTADRRCFRHKSPTYGSNCTSLYGYDAYHGDYCYYNCGMGLYAVGSKCYAFRTPEHPTNTSCLAAFGVDSYYDGTYCYYNCSRDLLYVPISGKCYRYRSEYYSSGACSLIRGPDALFIVDGDHRYCYYNCTAGLFSAGGRCYVHRYNAAQCSTSTECYLDSANGYCYCN